MQIITVVVLDVLRLSKWTELRIQLRQAQVGYYQVARELPKDVGKN